MDNQHPSCLSHKCCRGEESATPNRGTGRRNCPELYNRKARLISAGRKKRHHHHKYQDHHPSHLPFRYVHSEEGTTQVCKNRKGRHNHQLLKKRQWKVRSLSWISGNTHHACPISVIAMRKARLPVGAQEGATYWCSHHVRKRLCTVFCSCSHGSMRLRKSINPTRNCYSQQIEKVRHHHGYWAFIVPSLRAISPRGRYGPQG